MRLQADGKKPGVAACGPGIELADIRGPAAEEAGDCPE